MQGISLQRDACFCLPKCLSGRSACSLVLKILPGKAGPSLAPRVWGFPSHGAAALCPAGSNEHDLGQPFSGNWGITFLTPSLFSILKFEIILKKFKTPSQSDKTGCTVLVSKLLAAKRSTVSVQGRGAGEWPGLRAVGHSVWLLWLDP